LVHSFNQAAPMSQPAQGGFAPQAPQAPQQGGFAPQPQMGYFMSNGSPCPPQVVQGLQMANIQMWQQGTPAPQQCWNVQGYQ